jgi:hypothetical protein
MPAVYARNREICRSDRPVGTGKPTHDSARLAIVLAIASAAAAAEKFQKLSGAQIRAKLAGMEITDEVHWADVYGRANRPPNGSKKAFRTASHGLGNAAADLNRR